MSQWAPCPALWCFWRSDLSSRSKSFPSLCLSMFITFSLHKLIQSVLCMITVKFYGYSKDIIWTSLLAQLIKNPPTNAGDSVSIPGSGRSPGEGNGTPLQYSCLENSRERGAWWATVHGVTKSRHDWVTNTFTSNLIPSIFKKVRSREISFLAL